MNRQRRAESFANNVAEHLKENQISLPTNELLSSGYYWGMSEVLGEVQTILIDAESKDSSVQNTAICKAIRNYLKSVL